MNKYMKTGFGDGGERARFFICGALPVACSVFIMSDLDDDDIVIDISDDEKETKPVRSRIVKRGDKVMNASSCSRSCNDDDEPDLSRRKKLKKKKKPSSVVPYEKSHVPSGCVLMTIVRDDCESTKKSKPCKQVSFSPSKLAADPPPIVQKIRRETAPPVILDVDEETAEVTAFSVRLMRGFFRDYTELVARDAGMRAVDHLRIFVGEVVEDPKDVRKYYRFRVRSMSTVDSDRGVITNDLGGQQPVIELMTTQETLRFPNPLIEYTVLASKLCASTSMQRQYQRIVSPCAICGQCNRYRLIMTLDSKVGHPKASDAIRRIACETLTLPRLKSQFRTMAIDLSTAEWDESMARRVSSQLEGKDLSHRYMMYLTARGLDSPVVRSARFGLMSNFIPREVLVRLSHERDLETLCDLLLAVPEVCVHASLMFEILLDKQDCHERALLYKLWPYEFIASASTYSRLVLMVHNVPHEHMSRYRQLREQYVASYPELACAPSQVDVERLVEFSRSIATYGQSVRTFENPHSSSEQALSSPYHRQMSATDQWCPEGRHYRITTSHERLMRRFSDIISEKRVTIRVVHAPHIPSVMSEISQYILPWCACSVVLAPNVALANYASERLAPIVVLDYWEALRRIADTRPDHIFVLWAHMLGIEWWLVLFNAYKTHSSRHAESGSAFLYSPVIHVIGNEVSPRPVSRWGSRSGNSYYGSMEVFQQFYRCAQSNLMSLITLGTDESINTASMAVYRAWSRLYDMKIPAKIADLLPVTLSELDTRLFPEGRKILNLSQAFVVRADDPPYNNVKTMVVSGAGHGTKASDTSTVNANMNHIYETGALLRSYTTRSATDPPVIVGVCQCDSYRWGFNCASMCKISVPISFVASSATNRLTVGTSRLEPIYEAITPSGARPVCVCSNIETGTNHASGLVDFGTFQCANQRDNLLLHGTAQPRVTERSKYDRVPVWNTEDSRLITRRNNYTGAPTGRTVIIVGSDCSLLDILQAMQIGEGDPFIMFPSVCNVLSLRECVRRLGYPNNMAHGAWLADRLTRIAKSPATAHSRLDPMILGTKRKLEQLDSLLEDDSDDDEHRRSPKKATGSP